MSAAPGSVRAFSPAPAPSTRPSSLCLARVRISLLHASRRPNIASWRWYTVFEESQHELDTLIRAAEGVGKSTIVTSFIKEAFVPDVCTYSNCLLSR
jgi:hypothetical protein